MANVLERSDLTGSEVCIQLIFKKRKRARNKEKGHNGQAAITARFSNVRSI
jgi:hypothetical protein